MSSSPLSFTSSGTRRTLILVLVACAASFFVGLGSTPLWDPDEPRFAASTREMVATGDILSPSFNGEPRFEKPILFYWLQLPFFLVLGPIEAAARLPSALAGVGCVLLLYAFGRSFFGERAGVLGALALATVFRFVAYARQGLTDVPAMFLEMAALFAFMRSGEDDPRSGRYAYAGWMAVGLCALTKGPVAVIPVLVWLAHVAITRDRAAFARWRAIPGLLLACALALPWYVYMAAVHGRAFLDLALRHEIVRRAVDFPGSNRGFWYYMPIWPADALPWTLFFLLGVAHAVSVWRTLDPVVRRGLVLCGLWFVTVLLLFSTASGKLPHYLLPIYAPLALVAGFYIDRVARGTAGIHLWQGAAALTAITLGVLAFVSTRLLERVSGESAIVSAGLLLPVLLAAGGLGVLSLAIVRPRPIAATFALVATLVTSYAFAASYTLPRQLSGLFPTAQLGRTLATVATPRDRVGIYHVIPSSTLVFYSQHIVQPAPSQADAIRFLEERGRAFFVVPDREVRTLRQQSRARLYEFARRPKIVARFNRLFGRRKANLDDGDLVVLTNQPLR